MGATRRIQRSVIVMSSFLSGRGLIIDRITGKIGHFATHAAIIHIDIDSASISRNIEVDIPIVADAKTALLALLEKATEIRYAGMAGADQAVAGNVFLTGVIPAPVCGTEKAAPVAVMPRQSAARNIRRISLNWRKATGQTVSA